MANYEVSFGSVNIPAGSGGISVIIEEDSDVDGTVENSETIALSDAVTSYTSSDVFAGTGQVRLDFDIGAPTDVTVAGSVTAPIDINVNEVEILAWDTETEFDAGTYDKTVYPTSTYRDLTNRLRLGYSATDTDLVGFWPLDSPETGYANDITNGNNATNNGGIGTTTGYLGTDAYDLDGSNDYSVLPAMGSYDTISILFSIKPDVKPPNTASDYSGMIDSGSDEIAIYFDEINDIFPVQLDNTQLGSFNLSAVTVGEWNNLAVVHDNSQNMTYLYQDTDGDGVLEEVDSGSQSIGSIDINANDMTFGSGDGSGGYLYDGGLENVRFYRSAKTQSAINNYFDNKHGNWQSATKSFSAAADLSSFTLSGSIPTNTSVDVEVYDSGGTLLDSKSGITSTGTYSITGRAQTIYVVAYLNTSDVTVTPSLTAIDVTGTTVITVSDSAVGSETLSQLTNAVSDMGTGTGSFFGSSSIEEKDIGVGSGVFYGESLVKKEDIGAGQELIGFPTKEFIDSATEKELVGFKLKQLRDKGIGSEALTELRALVKKKETAIGTSLVGFPLKEFADSATGEELIGFPLKEFKDIGSGQELVSIPLKTIITKDAATGQEFVGFPVKEFRDLGTGTGKFALIQALTDQAVGKEIFYSKAQIIEEDTGSGLEKYYSEAKIREEDISSGIDKLTKLLNHVSDLGYGKDVVSALESLIKETDKATGAEVPKATVLVEETDKGTGKEYLCFPVKQISDSGVGHEYIGFRPKQLKDKGIGSEVLSELRALVKEKEIGSIIEQIYSTAEIKEKDHATGIAKLTKLINRASEVASGIDTLSELEALVKETDLGSGIEEYYSRAQIRETDVAKGIELIAFPLKEFKDLAMGKEIVNYPLKEFMDSASGAEVVLAPIQTLTDTATGKDYVLTIEVPKYAVEVDEDLEKIIKLLEIKDLNRFR